MERTFVPSLAAVLLAGLPAQAANVCAARAGGVCVTRMERAAPGPKRARREAVRCGPVRVERIGRVVRADRASRARHNRPARFEARSRP